MNVLIRLLSLVAALLCLAGLASAQARETLILSPPSVSVGEPVSANVSAPRGEILWGDGVSSPATSLTVTHVYTAAGDYTVQWLCGGSLAGPCARATVKVTPALPTLNVTPTAVLVNEKVTATLTNFQPRDSLDWGDGSVTPAGATLPHVYSKAGTFAVKLLRAGQPVAGVAPVPVVVSLPTTTLSVAPNAVLVGENVTATLTNVQPGDQLDWSDGSVVPAAASLTHTYSKAGTFAVKLLRAGQPVAGVAPVPVVVSLPTTTLSVAPNAVLVGENVTATLTNVQPGDQLDWGDNSVVSAVSGLDHSYSNAGSYLVRLLRGGAPLGSVAPVPVTVTVPPVVCSVDVLTDLPLRWKPVQLKVDGLSTGTAYTLNWGDGTVVSGVSQATTTPGDGSKQNVQQHTYAKAASFVVQVKVGNAPPCVQPITVGAGPVPLAVDPNDPAVDQTVTLSVGDVPTGTALKVEWGDGSVQTLDVTGSGAATSPLGTHAYVKDSTFIIKVSLAQTGEPLGILPVVVGVPLPTLSVIPARAGTPSTISVGNLQSYPQYVYTLDFGDGTPKQSVKTNADVPHIFAVSGVYTVKLTIKADQASERTVVVVAVIDAAVGIDGFSTEVRPQAGAAVPAPTPAEVQIGTPTDSVALLNVTGSGSVNLRWTWTPLNVANQSEGQPLTLETRQVLLKAGQNSVSLKMPTGKSGRYLLRVEVLGVTGDSKAIFPGQISLQTVNLTEPGLPKFLVVGEGEDQFKFKILGAPKPQSGPLFNPNDFWPTLQVADDSPLLIGLTPVALQPIHAQSLKVKVDGDTAYLVSGSFEGVTQPIELDTGPVSFVYTEFPAFAPMRLKVQQIVFSPSGAVLSQAVVTSPDFSQSKVFKYLPPLLEKQLPGPRPEEVMQLMINQVFAPVFDVSLNPAGMPIAVPAPQPFGTQLHSIQQGQLPTGTGMGIGYATQQGQTLLDQAAQQGVYTGDGTAAQARHAPILTVAGPKTVEQLQEILGAGQTDFLIFPQLYLSNNGDVVSARMVDGKSVASFPTTPGAIYQNGVLQLGDSGVAMKAQGPQTAYLDLSSSRSVEPDSYVAGQKSGGTPKAPTPPISAGQVDPNAVTEFNQGTVLGLTSAPSQAELLRQTYGGAPSAVQVPDVGPQWQGLLWLSNQVTIDTVAQYDATKGDAEPTAGQSLSVELVKKVPVSYGTRGWNLNIEGRDGKVAAGKTELTGGIPYDAREIVVVMVKTNLIRSLTTGAFGPLPFVGGGKLTGTWDIVNKKVDLDKTGLTRAYGPDGSFTAKDVKGSVNSAGVLTFTLLGNTFDLARVGDGLTLNCSKVMIDGGLVQLPYSTCNSIQGQNRKVAGNPITFDSLKFSSEGKLIFAGLAALGNADENGKNVTATARFVLSADAQKYSLKLSVDDTQQQVSSTADHEVNVTLKGSENDLTGVGAQAFGAGPAGSATHEISFDSGTVGVSDKLSMQVKGVFGHKGTKSYWYLLATGKAADGIPLSIITIYQITGGLAYNMQWGKGQIYFSDLDKRPNDAAGLHLTAGVVASFTGVDDKTLHAAIIAEIGTSPLQLRFGGDGYLLTGGVSADSGYFGGGHPQARFAGTLNKDGLFVDLCVGPAEVETLKCSDLKPLSVADGVVTIQGSASIELSKTPHIYIGTFRPKSQIGNAYCNPTLDTACAALYRTGRVSATVDLKIFKATIDGYVMFGILDGRAPKFVQPGSLGLAAGASIEEIFHAGDSGSLGLCDYSWSFDARLFAAVDGAILVYPDPKIHGHVGLYAGASVSAYGCGIGGSLSASLSLDADFEVGKHGWVEGEVGVEIHLPIIPDISFSKNVHLDIY
ncbi:PKD domain-containing protein [Deinococcus alpinitundrae]|uniref:PKD domain-containing protein n=1 Tax=Deinococcus alpinitundrae TaxID=468913 RepID=UPI00137A2E99|nr:PKD domain-containing protein [Deinococcus alpinitundrae]